MFARETVSWDRGTFAARKLLAMFAQETVSWDAGLLHPSARNVRPRDRLSGPADRVMIALEACERTLV